jgi:hypothetical protein
MLKKMHVVGQSKTKGDLCYLKMLRSHAKVGHSNPKHLEIVSKKMVMLKKRGRGRT